MGSESTIAFIVALVMRVVAGKARAHKLQSVPGDTTRPILDRVKTALFDILRPRITDTQVLDLFAGSGSVGIEALSQGAKTCVFLDIEIKAIQVIKANLKSTRLESQAEVRQTDAFVYLRNTSKAFDLIYVAPPQYKGIWLEALRFIAERPELLRPQGQVIAQIDPKELTAGEELSFPGLSLQDQRRYGQSVLLFFAART